MFTPIFSFLLRILWLAFVLRIVARSWQPADQSAPKPELSKLAIISLALYAVQSIAGALFFLGFPIVVLLWIATIVGWFAYFRGVLALSWFRAGALLPVYLVADGLFSVVWRMIS